MTAESSADRARVLFVDDEPRILIAMKALFRNTYEVFTANSGDAALDILRDNDVDVVVSDQRMPQMTGVEFLRSAKRLRPRAIRVLLTGYSDLSAILDAINDGEIFRYINKPWANADLRATIADAVKASEVDCEPELVDDDPMSEAEAEGAQSSEASQPAAQTQTGGSGVLVLDDDEPTRTALHRVLSQERAVYTAQNLDQALDILEKQSVGVLVTDLTVDGDNVSTLLQALRQHHPSLVAIVLSAHADAGQSIELINLGQIYRFLNKPVGEGLLRGSINLAMRRHEVLLRNPQQTLRLVAENTAPPPPEKDKRGVFKRIGRLFGLTA